MSVGAQHGPADTPGSSDKKAALHLISSSEISQQFKHHGPKFFWGHIRQRCQDADPILALFKHHGIVALQLLQHGSHATACSVARHGVTQRFGHRKHHARRFKHWSMRHFQRAATKTASSQITSSKTVHAAKRCRPLRRRACITVRPPRVLILARNPCFLCLLRMLG